MIFTFVGFLFAIQSIQPAYADPSEVSLGQVMDESQNVAADIAYTSFVPVYEENQNPERSVRIELFLGEDDQSPASKQRIQWIRSQIRHDQRENPSIATSYETFGKVGDSAEGNAQVNAFWQDLGVSSNSISYESMPAGTNLEIKGSESAEAHSTLNSKTSRKPAAGLGRSFWTAIRFTSSLGASYIGLRYGFHVAAETALITSLLPALGSGSICYFSPQFGRYLVNKAWSDAIVNGTNPFARKLQKWLKLDPVSMAARSEVERMRVLSRLQGGEEMTRWYLSELVFTLGLIKIPQRIAQITQEGLLRAGLLGVKSSVLGYLAQGSGDLAVSQRKIQKFIELRDALVSGQLNHPDKDRIVRELDEILDPAINRNADTTVHPMIQKIENWARSRGVLMSFVCVAGVVLDSVGVSASSYLLVTLGVSGAIYYTKVNGWFAPESRISVALQNTRTKLEKFSRRFLSLPERICKDDVTGNEPGDLSLKEFRNFRERFVANYISLHQNLVL